MVVLEAFGLAANELFNYNREIYKFDQEQRVEKDMARVEYQIKRFDLFREDIEDLVELTVSKMDMYHMVGALLLAFTCTIYTEGLFRGVEPPWYTGLYYMSVCNGFIYLLCSVWLSMHASVQAQSYGARLRTRFVRLPIPSFAVISDLTAKLGDFERQGLAGIMRLPFGGTQPSWQRRNALDSKEGENRKRRPGEWTDSSQGFKFGAAAGAEGPGTQGNELIGRGGDGFGREEIITRAAKTLPGRHVQLFRDLQAKWQCYDAYARVCMSIGVNQMIQSINYFVVGSTLAERWNPTTAIAVTLILQTVALGLMFLDIADKPIARALPLSRGVQIVIMQVIGSAPIVIAMILLILGHGGPCPSESDEGGLSPESEEGRRLEEACNGGKPLNPYAESFYLAPVCYFMQAIWFQLELLAAWPYARDDASLPRKFLAVLFLDVFGDASYDPTEAEQAPVTPNASPGGWGHRKQQTRIAAAEEALAMAQVALRRWEAIPHELLSDSQSEQLMHLRRDYMFWRQRLQGHIVQTKMARGVVDDPSLRDAQELRKWAELSDVEKREDEYALYLIGPLQKRNVLRSKVYYYDLESSRHCLAGADGRNVLTLADVVAHVERVKTAVRGVLAPADGGGDPIAASSSQLGQPQARMGASNSQTHHGKKERLPWKLVRRLTNTLQLCWIFLGVQLSLQDADVWKIHWMYGRELRAVDARGPRGSPWSALAPVAVAWPHSGFFRPAALAWLPPEPQAEGSGLLAPGERSWPPERLLLGGVYSSYQVLLDGAAMDSANVVQPAAATAALPRGAFPRGATALCPAVGDVAAGARCWAAALAEDGAAVDVWPLGEDRAGAAARLALESGAAGAPAATWRLLAGAVAKCAEMAAPSAMSWGPGARAGSADDLCLALVGWDGSRIPVALVPLTGDGSGIPQNATLRPRLEAPVEGSGDAECPVEGGGAPCAARDVAALHLRPGGGRLWALWRGPGGDEVSAWAFAGGHRHLGRWPTPRRAPGGAFVPSAISEAAGDRDGGVVLWLAGTAGVDERPQLLRAAIALEPTTRDA